MLRHCWWHSVYSEENIELEGVQESEEGANVVLLDEVLEKQARGIVNAKKVRVG